MVIDKDFSDFSNTYSNLVSFDIFFCFHLRFSLHFMTIYSPTPFTVPTPGASMDAPEGVRITLLEKI